MSCRKTSTETGPFLVGVDLTAPSVTVTVDASTYTKAPLVRVTATDQNVATTTTVTLDVDTNNDGNFTDAGESGYMSVDTNGDVSPPGRSRSTGRPYDLKPVLVHARTT